MEPALLWTITTLLLIIGLFGTLIPAVPGVGLVFAGILFYAYMTGFSTISVAMVITLGVVMILVVLGDYAGSAVGAKVGGGKTKALIGTVVGAILGSLGGPAGIFIGAFIGAFLGASLEGHEPIPAAKIAALSVLGTLGAAVMQFVVAGIMIAVFLIAVFV